jgi:hypothetical protein
MLSDERPRVRDTIPRLHRIVDHPADQLVAMASGVHTFEGCRVRYGETARRLEAEGRGRVTASRVPESQRNWSPTRDLLQELMRWGAVAPAPVPSARTSLDAHRDRRYELSEKGRRLAEIAQRSRGEFTDAVADELIGAHPYFRGLLEALRAAPIVCPVPTEGDVARGRGGPAGWAAWASELMGDGANAETIELTVREHLERRFAGRTGEDRPTNKAVAESLTDAFAVAAFGAVGLHVDGPTIKTLQRWGTELLLYDQSRHVPSYPSANVMWSACDYRSGGEGAPRARRRGRATHGERVAQALIAAYRDQEGAGEGIALPVHRVRAQAGFQAGVTRALADRVLSDLVDGGYRHLGMRALAFIGSCELPDSEPAFRHRNRIRLEIQMVPRGAEFTTERSIT